MKHTKNRKQQLSSQLTQKTPKPEKEIARVSPFRRRQGMRVCACASLAFSDLIDGGAGWGEAGRGVADKTGHDTST